MNPQRSLRTGAILGWRLLVCSCLFFTIAFWFCLQAETSDPKVTDVSELEGSPVAQSRHPQRELGRLASPIQERATQTKRSNGTA